MGGKETLVQKLKEVRKNISKDYPVADMILFGSRARGRSSKYSDVDLIIVSSKFKGLDFIERGARMYDYWDLDYPVDFLCYTPEEYKKQKMKVSIVGQAAKEGVAI